MDRDRDADSFANNHGYALANVNCKTNANTQPTPLRPTFRIDGYNAPANLYRTLT